MAYTYSKAFEKWWKGYPRKTAKEAAYTAWLKLNGDADGDIQRILGFSLRAQLVKWNDEDRPISVTPYPATWLNGGAWKDFVKEDGTPDVEERDKTGQWFGGEWRKGFPESESEQS